MVVDQTPPPIEKLELEPVTKPGPVSSEGPSRPQSQILMPITFTQLEDKVTKVTWAWDGYLPNGSLIILFAPPEGGKSFLGLDLMRCVATGADWPDGSPNNHPPEKCLLIDYEGTQSEYLDRAKACGIPLDMLLTQPPEVLPYLTEQSSFDAFREWLEQTGVRFMVIDSWRDGALGVSEDSSGDVAPTLQPLKLLARNSDIPILLLHHPTKQQGKSWNMSMADVRGTGVFAAAARVMLAIDKPNPTSEARVLKVVKRNSGPKPKPLGFVIEDAGITWTDATYKRRSTPQMDKAKLAILNALQQEQRTNKELREAVEAAGVSKRTGDDALAALKDGDRPQVILGQDGRYGLVSCTGDDD